MEAVPIKRGGEAIGAAFRVEAGGFALTAAVRHAGGATLVLEGPGVALWVHEATLEAAAGALLRALTGSEAFSAAALLLARLLGCQPRGA
ncbi:hypothetical protein [Fervidobacterium sp.]